MEVLHTIDPCRMAIHHMQREGKRVGLVPTMGALHEGHLSLIRAARETCDTVAVSIFVNPTQFSPGEDYASYPKTMESDLEACRSALVDLVFTPTVDVMYPSKDDKTRVHVAGLTEGLCGANRPGHFDGVTTVVAKLFNIMPADVAFFGEKDYQQLMVINKMVDDLNIPIKIVGCPIVREKDGLALSSRNAYLSQDERRQARCLSRALFDAQKQIEAGVSDTATLCEGMRKVIDDAGPAEIDYITIVDAASLVPLSRMDRPARICMAVRIGPCRLIDNVGVDVPA